MSQTFEPAALDWTDGREAIVFERCDDCGARHYFRRGFCPGCGSRNVAVVESAGLGVVYAVTTVARAPSPEWKAIAPYAIALVDLDEGVRVMTHAVPDVAIGDRVALEFLRIGDRLIPRAALHRPDHRTQP